MTDLTAWKIGAVLAKQRELINELAWYVAEMKNSAVIVTERCGPFERTVECDWSAIHDYVADDQADDEFERPTQGSLDAGT